MCKILSATLFILGILTQAVLADTGKSSPDSLKMAQSYFHHRDDVGKLDSAIMILEKMCQSNKEYALFTLLSRAYYFRAEHEASKAGKLKMYDKGKMAGETALKTIEPYAKALKDGKKDEEALKFIEKDSIAALYWAAANVARWAKFTTFVKKVKIKSYVRALWDRLYELDADYFYGGGHRFFGGYLALVPAITGDQDPVKAKEMFDKAFAVAPEYLETKVLCAEAYCTHAKIKDKVLFKKLIDEVLATDLNTHPEIIPENKMAQAKAKVLKENEAELFE